MEKEEKEKKEHPKAEKHSRLKEKLHVAKHHIFRNCWKYTAITLIVLVIAFAALAAFGIFSVKYNGVGKKEVKGITMVVLNDERCGADCDTTQLVSQLKTLFPEATVKELDYSSKDGKALFESTKVQYLPAVLFTDTINTSANYAQVQQYLVTAGNYLSLRIGASFDPKAEICDNGIDDNANGIVDCADPECQDSLLCRPEKNASLMVFIMSDCPYGKKAVEALKELVGNFNNTFSYEVHYIASENNGTFSSLHGAYEAAEDVVQLCVKKYSPNQWLDYINCRSIQGISGNDWHTCANQTNVDIAKVETCASGEEGKELLRQDIKIAQSLNIGASPTWIANNKYQFGGIDAETVKTQFCQYNSGLAGCGNTLSSNTSVSGSCG